MLSRPRTKDVFSHEDKSLLISLQLNYFSAMTSFSCSARILLPQHARARTHTQAHERMRWVKEEQVGRKRMKHLLCSGAQFSKAVR